MHIQDCRYLVRVRIDLCYGIALKGMCHDRTIWMLRTRASRLGRFRQVGVLDKRGRLNFWPRVIEQIFFFSVKAVKLTTHV